MFWLGLLLAVCYVPGYTGASVPTQWAVLSILLPLGLWRVSFYGTGHRLLFGFVLYALLGALWSLNLYTWVWGMWLCFIWALAYHWGTLCADLRGLWKGLAVGLSVSTAIALAQALDFRPVEANDPYQYSGLFFNSSLFGVILGLVLVGLATHRLWWYMPPMALGLILSGSRGGFFIAAVGLVARFGSPVLAAGVFACAGIAFLSVIDLADSQRLQIWGVTLPALNFFGHGAGSFLDLYYVRNTKVSLIHPEFVHNDFLQLVYEYGIGTLFLIAIPALALAGRSAERPVLIAWLALSTFYFPLYAPIPAFIGFVVAGHCLRDWAVVRDHGRHWRSHLLSWYPRWRRSTDSNRREGIPMVTRTAQSES